MTKNNLVCAAIGIFTVFSASSIGESGHPSMNFGHVGVTTIIRVDSQCQIFCDIADWPAIIGKEVPIRIRGLDTRQAFSLEVRQIIKETLEQSIAAAKQISDPNQPQSKGVVLANIQRGETFCIIADIEASGGDLAQMLVDRGYAKKLLIPKHAAPSNPTDQPLSLQPVTSSAVHEEIAESYVASKSGKVFHKPSCPHAKRIQDNSKIIYSTRQDAISSGRRPCQTCNP